MRLEFGAALFLATFAVVGRAHTAPTLPAQERRGEEKKCRERAAVSLKRARDTFRR